MISIMENLVLKFIKRKNKKRLECGAVSVNLTGTYTIGDMINIVNDLSDENCNFFNKRIMYAKYR